MLLVENWEIEKHKEESKMCVNSCIEKYFGLVACFQAVSQMAFLSLHGVQQHWFSWWQSFLWMYNNSSSKDFWYLGYFQIFMILHKVVMNSITFLHTSLGEIPRLEIAGLKCAPIKKNHF